MKRMFLLIGLALSLVFINQSYAGDLDLGGSDYPSSLDTDPSPQTATDNINHLPIVGSHDAIINMQTEMGLNPSGNLADINTLLDVEHDNDGKHTFKYGHDFEYSKVGTGLSTVQIAVAGTDKQLIASETWDPASIADTDILTNYVTITGAALGDSCEAAFSLDTAGLQLSCDITASDTATALLQNDTNGAVDLSSGTVWVWSSSRNPTSVVQGVRMPWAGSVVGISCYTDSNITSGSATFDVTVAGTATGLQAVLNTTNPQSHSATQALGTDTFTAGQLLGIEVTTSGNMAPADSADMSCRAYVTFN